MEKAKIIKASAGTGKTYRLSLEFINLILTVTEDFDEILVITFTKKAAAEIRNAVFSHIEDITQGNEKGKELRENLRKLFSVQIDARHLERLKRIHSRMITNKHKLRISTIDSFTASVFKSIIAPYMGIVDFEINNEINSHYMPEIFNRLIKSPEFFRKFDRLFRAANYKTIENYSSMIFSIIENRWLIEMMKECSFFRQEGHSEQIAELAEQCRCEYIGKMKEIIARFRQYLEDDGKTDKPLSAIIAFDYRKISGSTSTDICEWLDKFSNSLTSTGFIGAYWEMLLQKPHFWNGTRCLKAKVYQDLKADLFNRLEECKGLLSDYIFLTHLLPEHEDIIKLADTVTDIYDDIKMRDHIFSYSDITFYTFRHLYDPQLSMIDLENGTVENRFYEYLSTNTRYMLIDEYQDTGTIQHKILLPIMKEIISGQGAKDYGGTIIVGDEKQSIYGWRSGERELLIKIPEILNNAATDTLDVSYRSTAFIMKHLNEIFSRLANQVQEIYINPCSKADNSAEDGWVCPQIEPHNKEEQGYFGACFYPQSDSVDRVREALPEDTPAQYLVNRFIKPHHENGSIDLSDTVILARKNSELTELAAALAEAGIPFFQEASVSVIHHPAVKPVIYLLKLIKTKNILYLLQFLRSDVCLVYPQKIKDIIRDYQNSPASVFPETTDEIKESGDKLLAKVQRLMIESRNLDLLAVIYRIIDEFGIVRIFNEEHHLKNIHLFIELAAGYINSDSTGSSISTMTPTLKTVAGFIKYLEDNEKDESLQQENIEQTDAVRLLTVHKAKGLQFETVFYYFNASGRKRDKSRSLEFYYLYDQNLTGLKEGYLTFKYSKALEKKPIFLRKLLRDNLEELNNIYVALTRAKRNLLVFIPYTNKDGMPGVEKEMSKKLEKLGDNLFNPLKEINLQKLFICDLFNYLSQQYTGSLESNHLFTMTFGDMLTASGQQPETRYSEYLPYEKYILFDRSSLLKKPKEDYIDKKSVYLTEKLPLKGEIVHYYLSRIYYADAKELAVAADKTISFYGNIMTAVQIRELIKKTDSFISSNPGLFSKCWNKIFNEKTVFDAEGKEYRIDRLMIDEKKKVILIVDYKTGLVDDTGQLEKYIEIISRVPFVSRNNYSVEGKYIEL